MQAIVRTRYGSPDVVHLRDVATPFPRPRGARPGPCRVDEPRGDCVLPDRCPVHHPDGDGTRRPRHAALGLDAAGIVASVGTGVTRFAPGDRVFGNLTMYGYGAFAEYACAPERAWAPMPAGATFELGSHAARSIDHRLAGPARRALDQARPGHSVLVNGASGNVGPFAVQLAKSFGAEVTGVWQHAEDGLRAVARRRPCDRLHARRLHPPAPA